MNPPSSPSVSGETDFLFFLFPPSSFSLLPQEGGWGSLFFPFFFLSSVTFFPFSDRFFSFLASKNFHAESFFFFRCMSKEVFPFSFSDLMAYKDFLPFFFSFSLSPCSLLLRLPGERVLSFLLVDGTPGSVFLLFEV